MTKLAKAEPVGLLNVEVAKRYLAECTTAFDAKSLRDQAAAAEKYLRSQRFNMKDAERAAFKASSIKVRSERRVGELLAAMAKAGTRAGRGGDRKSKSQPATLILEELGIDRSTSARWQQEAQVPEEVFEAYEAECEAVGEAVTSAGTRACLHTSSDADYDGDEWFTPRHVIETVRVALGGIDLDPASNNHAQETVQARRFFTKDTNGLTQPWTGRVFCNPPYSMPLIDQFTAKLIEELDAHRTVAAIYLVNNCTDTAWFQSLLRRFPVCFTTGRLKFENSKGVGFATRQGQALFALGAVALAPLRDLGTVVEVLR